MKVILQETMEGVGHLGDLIDVKDDGSFWLDMDYFNYCQGLTMTSERFHALSDG